MEEEKLNFEKVWLMFQETEKQFAQADARLKEAQSETNKQIKEVSKQIAEHGIQIGGINNKFGTFTEGLVYPSIEKELQDKFKVTHVTQRVRNKAKKVEIDILGYSNGTKNEAFVVEVKSHLREEALDQILNILEHFKENFPEHKDKKVYGMIASIHTNEYVLAKIEKAGIYYANVANNIFELKTSINFIPRVF